MELTYVQDCMRLFVFLWRSNTFVVLALFRCNNHLSVHTKELRHACELINTCELKVLYVGYYVLLKFSIVWSVHAQDTS